MLRSLSLAALATIACLAPAAAQDAQSILKTMREKQLTRWQTVQNYTVKQSSPFELEQKGPDPQPDLQPPIYYEKTDRAGQVGFRMVPQKEYMRKAMLDAGCPEMTPDQMQEYAIGLKMMGDAVSHGGGDMPANGGIPGFTGFDLQFVTDSMSSTIWNVAEEEKADESPDATVEASPAAEFVRRAHLEGVEPALASKYVPDEPGQKRDAYLIVADGLSDIPLEQPKGGGKFTLDRISLWVDKEEYVPLRMLIEGQVESEGKTAPITLDRLDLDYQPAGPLYEPRQHVYRMSGLMGDMSDKDQQDLQKARDQLAELQAKLNSMPASQQAMVKKMMGGQIKRLEQMVSSGDFISSIDIVDIAVNEGPPLPWDREGKPIDCRK